MTQIGLKKVEHEIMISASADKVYQLIADVENWPRIFPPTVHAERVELSGNSERIRIWATANGAAKNWTSRRVLDPALRRIEFRQEVTTAPVAAMGGTWIVETIDAEQCKVRLLHDYRAVDDDPEGLAWIDEAVDRNSRSELAALKANVERIVGPNEELLMSFEDTIRIRGELKDVYEFLNEAGLWKERLAHVARVELTEDEPGLQVLEMDTRTKDGSTHTTKSVRVCFPNNKIVYKQTTLPALMTVHTGYWLLEEAGDSVYATSQHTVVINTENITAVLGQEAGLAQARDFVKKALSGNSGDTLGYAKDHAEARRS